MACCSNVSLAHLEITTRARWWCCQRVSCEQARATHDTWQLECCCKTSRRPSLRTYTHDQVTFEYEKMFAGSDRLDVMRNEPLWQTAAHHITTTNEALLPTAHTPHCRRSLLTDSYYKQELALIEECCNLLPFCCILSSAVPETLSTHLYRQRCHAAVKLVTPWTCLG